MVSFYLVVYYQTTGECAREVEEECKVDWRLGTIATARSLLHGRMLQGPFRTKISTPKKEGGISQNMLVVNSVRKSWNIRS